MFQLRIMPERKLIIIKYSGQVNAGEVFAVLAKIVEDQPDRTGFNTLSISGKARFDLTSDEMVQLIEWMSAHQAAGSKSALVVEDSHNFGLSRMWATHSEDRLPHDVQIFYAMDKACTWLGYSPADIEQILAEMG